MIVLGEREFEYVFLEENEELGRDLNEGEDMDGC